MPHINETWARFDDMSCIRCESWIGPVDSPCATIECEDSHHRGIYHVDCAQAELKEINHRARS